MEQLRATGIAEALLERVQADQPLLGIASVYNSCVSRVKSLLMLKA